jgi:hypothetical protein
VARRPRADGFSGLVQWLVVAAASRPTFATRIQLTGETAFLSRNVRVAKGIDVIGHEPFATRTLSTEFGPRRRKSVACVRYTKV